MPRITIEYPDRDQDGGMVRVELIEEIMSLLDDNGVGFATVRTEPLNNRKELEDG